MKSQQSHGPRHSLRRAYIVYFNVALAVLRVPSLLHFVRRTALCASMHESSQGNTRNLSFLHHNHLRKDLLDRLSRSKTGPESAQDFARGQCSVSSKGAAVPKSLNEHPKHHPPNECDLQRVQPCLSEIMDGRLFNPAGEVPRFQLLSIQAFNSINGRDCIIGHFRSLSEFCLLSRNAGLHAGRKEPNDRREHRNSSEGDQGQTPGRVEA